jgi:vacuolar-type H+-ATPase subunit H
MIEEHLSRIRSKEEEARARTAEAAARAAELVERAREDGRRHVEDVKVEAAELERSLMAASRRSADEKISGLRAENAKKLAALVVLAKKNQSKAVETIVKEFRQGA